MKWFSPTTDRKLGSIESGPSKSLQYQLETVREKIEKTSALALKYNKKLSELTEFNEKLTYGYINNLNVIVDISVVLNEYRMLMTSVIDKLQEFDSSIADDFQKINIEHIRELTNEKLDNVARFFQSAEFSKLKDTLVTQGKTEAAGKIHETENNFRTLKLKASDTYSSLKQGGRQQPKSKPKSTKTKSTPKTPKTPKTSKKKTPKQMK
jgi:hypothetical protein